MVKASDQHNQDVHSHPLGDRHPTIVLGLVGTCLEGGHTTGSSPAKSILSQISLLHPISYPISMFYSILS
jgi:hypothetical protein